MNRYKNKALNLDEMRRRREEEGIQLRKQKREQQVGGALWLAFPESVWGNGTCLWYLWICKRFKYLM